MKPIVFALTITFASGTGVLLAARQATAPSSQPAHKVFILNGCLTTNATSTGVAADSFKLTGAVPVGQPPPERPAASTEAKNEYVLLPVTGLSEQGVARAEMQTHVGRKVEVTVRPVEVAPGPAPSSPPASAAEKIEAAAPQRYTVTTIMPAAGSCPGR